MIVIPKYCYSVFKLNMKCSLRNIRLNLLILRENSLKTVKLPDFDNILNRKLNEEVSWSFSVPTPPIHVETVLAGNPQPFSCDIARCGVPKNWSFISKKNNNVSNNKPKKITDTGVTCS